MILKSSDTTTVNNIKTKGYNNMQRPIIGFGAKILGFEENETGDQRLILDSKGRKIGYYHVSGDMTYDKNNRPVGRGDLRRSLL